MQIFKPYKFFLFFFLIVRLVLAQDYYVSDSNGSDNNPGTIEAPFKTINKGISMVNAGGIVYVMEGIYQNENYGTVDPSTNTNMDNPHVVTINKSGNEGAYITLRNYPGDTPKIQFDGRGGIVISNDMNYIIVEGFEVEGPAQAINYDMAIADRNHKIEMAEDGDDSTNYNNTYFGGKGIWGGYGAHNNIIIRNNIVHDTCGSAIRFNDSDHILIENNIVYNSNWWTSSASSAIVLAESIAVSGDNSDDIKMIIRGNIVYNNWNRIPFYVTQLPDNSGNTNPNYGTAEFNNIWDGQGIYVTRSDPGYAGTFLFENNLCLNNGKNGINFDHSHSASAIYQNNTLYYNGVHEIIQDISVADGNPPHRGQKVGGIKANQVLNATVVNNIIVTRDNEFSALALNMIEGGNKTALNNIIVNGTYAWPATEINNLINVDPMFISAPETVSGSLIIEGTDFSLSEDSPAINSGNTDYSPTYDILGNPRPNPINPSAISYTSFENSTSGWNAFGSTIQISFDESHSGNKSLLTTNRTANWHSPRIDLHNLGLAFGQTYTIFIWVKLSSGDASGTAQLVTKETIPADNPNDNSTAIYNSLTATINISDNEWTLISANYLHETENNIFLYVKGPPTILSSEGVSTGVDFYIDDFSLVEQGMDPVNFETTLDIIDIGAYEFSNNECVNDTTPPVIQLSDCGGSGCNYEYEINSSFDLDDIYPPTVNDNCDGDISYNVSHNVDTSTPGVYLVTFTASDYSGNSASSQAQVTVFDPLSISENNIENIFLSPNPAKDILNIHNVYPNSSISIFDILGKKYEINVINNFESNLISINTSNLDQGLYFIYIEDINTGQLKILRLIKQ